jgi:hypothetical protein
LAPFVPREVRRPLARDGMVAIPNFLPPEEFARLRAEMARPAGPVFEVDEGRTITHLVFLDSRNREAAPTLARAADDKRLRRLLTYITGQTGAGFRFAQAIHNGYGDAAKDTQEDFHTDTFHPTAKAWLYLQDVPVEAGPLRYYKGSHRLTRARLGWHYRESLKASGDPRYKARHGSFRIDEQDIPDLGGHELVEGPYPANTLIVADTFGFHCRGPAREPFDRYALFASARPSPFVPLLWPAPGLVDRLRHDAASWWLSRSRGGSWRPVDRARFSTASAPAE